MTTVPGRVPDRDRRPVRVRTRGHRSHKAIDAQERKDCLTLRKDFLDHAGPLTHTVVHGHSITDSRLPEVVGSRIGLDTGAYGTGRLTALIIDPAANGVEFVCTTETETGIMLETVDPVLPPGNGSAPNYSRLP